MKSAVSKDIDSHSVVSGQPAMDHRQYMRLKALIRRLPKIYRELMESKERDARHNDEEEANRHE